MRRAAVALVLFAAGCGFQLRGVAEVPFRTVYVPGTGGIALELRRTIANGTRAEVVDDARRADAILEFTQEARQKEILSLTTAGRVREFRLGYLVAFRVHDGRGGEYVPPTLLRLTRDISFSDEAVLAKEAEEQLLYRDMQSDMVQQILRRLAAARPPRPEAR